MKRIVLLSIMTFMSLTSCTSGQEEISNTSVKTPTQTMMAKGEDITADQQAAADAVQADQKQALASQVDMSTNRAISCHTSYLNDAEGHACVTINGQTFNVSWTNVVSDGGGHLNVLDEPVYTSTPVKSCRC